MLHSHKLKPVVNVVVPEPDLCLAPPLFILSSNSYIDPEQLIRIRRSQPICFCRKQHQVSLYCFPLNFAPGQIDGVLILSGVGQFVFDLQILEMHRQ